MTAPSHARMLFAAMLDYRELQCLESAVSAIRLSLEYVTGEHLLRDSEV